MSERLNYNHLEEYKKLEEYFGRHYFTDMFRKDFDELREKYDGFINISCCERGQTKIGSSYSVFFAKPSEPYFQHGMFRIYKEDNKLSFFHNANNMGTIDANEFLEFIKSNFKNEIETVEE